MAKRILFVDDDIAVLEGLQRMLRPMRHEWDMDFAQNGFVALALMEREPFDVIVSDMRMPGMDGAQLLAEVRARFPQVVRVILSGESGEQSVLKSVASTHVYLAKPCSAEALKAAIMRPCGLREMLNSPELQKLTAQIDHLPSLPTVFVELSEELRQDEPSLPKIASIMSRDMAMTAKLLQMVNSAFFGYFGRISSPERAVVMLGTHTIASLVLSATVSMQFDSALMRNFAVDALMKHGIGTGALAKLIAQAEQAAPTLVEEALTAGLLHDIGTLVIASNLPDRYTDVLRVSRAEGIPVWEAELASFGTTHAEVGAYLVGIWGLPEPVAEALAFHHRPENCADKSFSPLTAVHVADIWEHELRSETADHVATVEHSAYLQSTGLAQRIPVWRTKCSAAAENKGR
jgi:HD-like signal output (HDOD) protein